MKNITKTTLCITALAGFGLAGTSTAANVLINSGLLFTAAGHTDGDDAGHTAGLGNAPTSWSSSSGTQYYASDDNSIFELTDEFLQYQGTSADIYQQMTIGAGPGVFSIDAQDRSDNVNNTAVFTFDLYAGHLTTFGGAAITADSGANPVLTTSAQTFTKTYNTLAAGDYTVRVRMTSGVAAQAGLDNVMFDATAVPEPSTTALLGLGGLALILRRRK